MTNPNGVTCPGETLAEWIDYTGIPDSSLWNVWRIPEAVVNNVLAGVEPVTPEIAEQLERVTFIPARFWLALEHNYRAGLAAGCTHVPHWVTCARCGDACDPEDDAVKVIDGMSVCAMCRKGREDRTPHEQGGASTRERPDTARDTPEKGGGL